MVNYPFFSCNLSKWNIRSTNYRSLPFTYEKQILRDKTEDAKTVPHERDSHTVLTAPEGKWQE